MAVQIQLTNDQVHNLVLDWLEERALTAVPKEKLQDVRHILDEIDPQMQFMSNKVLTSDQLIEICKLDVESNLGHNLKELAYVELTYRLQKLHRVGTFGQEEQK
jgi:hypothetical protein